MAERGKRVLIIVENLPVPNDRRVWLEATTLTQAGYEVSVISIKGKTAQTSYELLDGVHIHRYPAPPQTSGTLSFIIEFSYCWIMSFILSFVVLFRRGFDIIHACNPPETFWLIGVFYKLFGKKFLFDHHDLSPEMYYSRFGKQGTAYRLLLLLERLTFRTADVVMTTNETHRRVAIERGNFPDEKIFIVRSGPDPDRLIAGPADESLKQGRQYMVSYLGVINPQDGVELFIEAIEYIVKQRGREDILFVIMGTGDALADLQAMSARLGLDDYIHFTGWVNMDVIVPYLSTTDVGVDSMPKTPYGDACTMNKILEYMSASVPSVAFDLTETRYSAQEAAVYATPNDVQEFADNILDLLADPAARARMGEYGRARIEQELAWEHQAPKLLAAYDLIRSL